MVKNYKLSLLVRAISFISNGAPTNYDSTISSIGKVVSSIVNPEYADFKLALKMMGYDIFPFPLNLMMKTFEEYKIGKATVLSYNNGKIIIIKISETYYRSDIYYLGNFQDSIWNGCPLVIKTINSNTTLDNYIGSNNVFGNYPKINLNNNTLLVGKPGSGKTSYILRNLKDKRILIVGNCQLYHINLEAFRPDVLLIDDFDRFNENDYFPVLEECKNRKIQVILTANSLNGISESVFRPGRIDDVIEIPLPDIDNRKAIIEGYGHDVTDRLLEMTDGMTGAYIKYLLEQIEQVGIEDAQSLIERRKGVIGKYAQELPSPKRDDA